MPSRYAFSIYALIVAACLIFNSNISAADSKDKDKKEISFDLTPAEMLVKLRTTPVEEIKPEEFEWSRKLYEKRFRPLDMDFIEKEGQKYIQTLPQELQAGEKLRFDKIKDVRPLLIRIFERNPYEGKNGIKIRSTNGNTTSVSGTIALANEEMVIVKKGKSSKSSKRYKWEDFPLEQYESFLIYYAGKRVNITGPGVSKEDSRKFAGEDYFRLALLCDWFGKYENCLTHLKKAIELNPDLKDAAPQILFN